MNLPTVRATGIEAGLVDHMEKSRLAQRQAIIDKIAAVELTARQKRAPAA